MQTPSSEAAQHPPASLDHQEAEHFEHVRLLKVSYLRGPNVWTYRPALEVWLDLGPLELLPSNRLPGFTERLLTALPSLNEHHCGVGESGGFVERLKEGTWAGHILEHIVIELLNLAGMPTGFGQTRSTSKPGIYRMVFRAREERVARAALAEGLDLLMAVINRKSFQVREAVARVRDKVDECYLGPSTISIVAAATDRKIPHIRLNDGNLVQLGHGARQRRIWTAETDETSAIAEGVARDKDLTKELLASCGIPVPEGQIARSPADAWDIAQDIGLPVVVKPVDGNHGRGVSIELKTEAEVADAYRLAEVHGSEVLVERFVRGNEHRLLVVAGKVVAAARGEAAWVVADGVMNVIGLVDKQLNSDPRRGLNEDFPLNFVETTTDEAVVLELHRQRLTPESVPVAGRNVLIQRNGNVAIDCTDEVHPEVAYVAALAARVVGLDIAGIDLVAEDISRPLQEQGGAIVEVNAGPGLLMHLRPAVGKPRPVGRAIVDHLFGEGETGRIPVVGIAGSRQTSVTARLVAWLVHLSGKYVGLSCRDGLFLDRRQVEADNCVTWDAGHRLLMNRNVQAAVIENDAYSILKDGLAYDRCQVGVVTDLDGFAELADFDITDSDQMVKVMRTQMDVVLAEGVGVLNASDSRLVEMSRLCDGEVILFGADAGLKTLAEHRANGGRVVYLGGDLVMLGTVEGEIEIAELPVVSMKSGSAEKLPADAVLAAAAVAVALGISPELISAGMATFDFKMSPARAAAGFAYAR